MPFANRITKMVGKIKILPASMQSWGLTKAVGFVVKMVGHSGVRVHSMSHNDVVVSVQNKKKVQNHIGGVHACATAMLAETATGLVVGMNVPDSSINLLKSMQVQYVKRCIGGVTAKAHLTNEQVSEIQTLPKGEIIVPVVVTDDSGQEIVECEMLWAWVPKKRS